jgi:hypothetical protein
MKPLLKSVQAIICLTDFLFTMVSNKGMVHCNCFPTLRYAISNVHVNAEELKLNETHQFLFYIHSDVTLGEIPYCETVSEP